MRRFEELFVFRPKLTKKEAVADLLGTALKVEWRRRKAPTKRVYSAVLAFLPYDEPRSIGPKHGRPVGRRRRFRIEMLSDFAKARAAVVKGRQLISPLSFARR